MDRQDSQRGLLAQWIEESSRIVFFGGAGVSTESGIPDFRGAKGFYHQDREIPLEQVLSIDFFTVHPQAYWEWFAQENAREGVSPNDAHRFVADLERAGKLSAVVTQNIDGLHQRAGSERVLELHGNWSRLTCTGCGERFTLDDVDDARSGEVPPLSRVRLGATPGHCVLRGDAGQRRHRGGGAGHLGGGPADRGRHEPGRLPGGGAHRLLRR